MATESSVTPDSLPHWKSPVWNDAFAHQHMDLLSQLPFAEGTTGEVLKLGCYDPFPFLRLPGELRNKVYGYVYRSDEIIIRNLRPERYKPGCPRTEYEAMPEYEIHGERVLQKTTYEIVAPDPYRYHHTKPFPRGLFFANRQIQREVAPFIYRKQHHFKHIQAIVPYL